MRVYRAVLTGALAIATAGLGAISVDASSWSAGPSMTSARHDGTATLLGNGDVLVVGGSEGEPSVERYHPSTGAWSAATSLLVNRNLHTATLLADGRVLVAGGVSNASGHSTATAEIYDPAADTWSSAGSMSVPRYDHIAARLPDGRVLVAGGQNLGGYIDRAEIYDPATNRWSAAATMDAGYFAPTATVLENGKVLVAGGYTFGDGRAELYDPQVNRWSNAGIMRRTGHTATLLKNGKVLVAGGGESDSTEIYDPASNSWSPAASMLTGRGNHVATLLPDGNVLVTGGDSFKNGQQVWLSSAEVYDPGQDRWSAAGCMSHARWSHTATLLASGRVLVAGGVVPVNGGNTLAEAQLFDPAGGPSGGWPCPTEPPTDPGLPTPYPSAAPAPTNAPPAGASAAASSPLAESSPGAIVLDVPATATPLGISVTASGNRLAASRPYGEIGIWLIALGALLIGGGAVAGFTWIRRRRV